MMIVLDTHIIIWDVFDSKQLSSRISDMIQQADRDQELVISDISLWEISMLINKQRLQIETDTLEFLNAVLQVRNFTVVPINSDIAVQSVQFMEQIQCDPADSIIMATAKTTKAALITADQKIRKSNLVKTIWRE